MHSTVRAWLDAHAADEETLSALVDEVSRSASAAASGNGTTVELTVESTTPLLSFDVPLRDAVAASVARVAGGSGVPILPTAAGHDAGILTDAGVPAAMLFVRNPTGISHSPVEHAEPADCHAGVAALAATLTDLAR